MHTREHLYIEGNWVEPTGEGSIEVINPANEKIIGSVPVGSAADVEAAVAAAKAASQGGRRSRLRKESVT